MGSWFHGLISHENVLHSRNDPGELFLLISPANWKTLQRESAQPTLSFKHMSNQKNIGVWKRDCRFVISVQVGVWWFTRDPASLYSQVCQVSTRARYFPSVIYAATASSWNIFCRSESSLSWQRAHSMGLQIQEGKINPERWTEYITPEWKIKLSASERRKKKKKNKCLKRGNQLNTRYEGKNVTTLIILLMIKEESHILKLQASGTVCVKLSEMRCSEFNREFSGVRKKKGCYAMLRLTLLYHSESWNCKNINTLSTGKTTVLSGTQKQRVKERNWERNWQIFRNEHHGNILRRPFHPFKRRLREWQSKKMKLSSSRDSNPLWLRGNAGN